MYLIVQPSSNKQIFFPLSERGDSTIQTALSECDAKGSSRLVCLCKGLPGAPMWGYASRNGELYPRRVDRTGERHAMSCRHGDAPDLASAYGAAPGAFMQTQGQPLIDLGRLFRGPDKSNKGGGKSIVPSRAPGMLSLAWFLMTQAGLTIWHRDLKRRNPWLDLYFAAREVQVKARKTIVGLDKMFLLPKEADPRQAAFNYAKLRDAANAGHSVIVMALLPPAPLALHPTGALPLRDSLGAIVTVFPEKLNTGLAKFSLAAHRWKRGLGPVLLVGLATPKVHHSPGQAIGRPMANVEHFALLNVSSDLVPVPSPMKERELSSCVFTREVYVTEPQDDGTLRLWSSRHRRATCAPT
jgi:hypothetical protein